MSETINYLLELLPLDAWEILLLQSIPKRWFNFIISNKKIVSKIRNMCNLSFWSKLVYKFLITLLYPVYLLDLNTYSHSSRCSTLYCVPCRVSTATNDTAYLLDNGIPYFISTRDMPSRLILHMNHDVFCLQFLDTTPTPILHRGLEVLSHIFLLAYLWVFEGWGALPSFLTHNLWHDILLIRTNYIRPPSNLGGRSW